MSNELGQTEETVIINGVRIPVAFLELAGFKREVKQGGRFKPEDGKLYWFAFSDGGMMREQWLRTDKDKRRYAMGNCYRTEEDTIAARDKQLALVRVQDKLEELTDEPLDWSSSDQFKGAIAYNHNKGIFIINDWLYVEVLGGLYGSKPACEWVIDNMESDLKLIAGVA